MKTSQDAFLIMEKKKQKKMAELLSQHQNLREVFWDMNKEKRIGDKGDFWYPPYPSLLVWVRKIMI